MLVVWHMVKTAGTTLNYILRNNYGWNHAEVRPIRSSSRDAQGRVYLTETDMRWFLKINPSLQSVSGHCLRPYSNIERVLASPKFITFLRDPIKRYLSHYVHSKRTNRTHLSLRQWVDQGSQNNYQTRFLANREDLEKAKQVLKEECDFIGLVEHFDLSLLLLKATLNLDLDIRYQIRNVSPTLLANDIPQDLMEKIESNNALDLSLYSFAERLFEIQKNCYPTDLSKDLHVYRSANKGYKFNRLQIMKFRFGKYIFYQPLGTMARIFATPDEH